MKTAHVRLLALRALLVILAALFQAALFQIGAAQALPSSKRVYNKDAQISDVLGWGADPGLFGRVKRLHLVQYPLLRGAGGKLVKAPDALPLFETTMTFDREGQMVKEVRKIGSRTFITGLNEAGEVEFGNEGEFPARYVLRKDANGHPLQLDTYVGDRHIRVEERYTCDETGRVISGINSLNQITSYAYDGQGRRISEETRFLDENGGSVPLSLTRFAYDREGRLIRTDAQKFFGGFRHSGEDREYDAAGRLIRIRNWTMRNGERVFFPVPTEENTFDDAGRLVRKRQHSPYVSGFVSSREIRYGYDAGGHLISLVRTGNMDRAARLVYSNDSRGNWIRCVRAEETGSSLLLRDIEYYPE